MEDDRIQKKTLEAPLSTNEKVEYQKKLVSMIVERQNKEAHQKLENDRMKSDIKKLTGDIDALANTLDRGCEWRDIEVRKDYDFENRRVHFIRLDTYEVIEDREMSELELQMNIPFPEEDDPDPDHEIDQDESEAA